MIQPLALNIVSKLVVQVQCQNFKFRSEFHFEFHSNVKILDYTTTSAVLVIEYLIQIMIQIKNVFFSVVSKKTSAKKIRWVLDFRI